MGMFWSAARHGRGPERDDMPMARHVGSRAPTGPAGDIARMAAHLRAVKRGSRHEPREDDVPIPKRAHQRFEQSNMASVKQEGGCPGLEAASLMAPRAVGARVSKKSLRG